MRFALYAGSTFLMGSNDREKLMEANATQLRRWIEEMGYRTPIDGEVVLQLTDKGITIMTRKFIPAMGRLHGWKK